MKLKHLIAAALAAFAVGCTSVPSGPNAAAQNVYQVKSDYTAAVAIANAYVSLPRCGTTVQVPGAATTTQKAILCSDPKVIVALQQADTVAYNAINAAENTVRTPCPAGSPSTCDPTSAAQIAATAAQQALTALTAITATLQTH